MRRCSPLRITADMERVRTVASLAYSLGNLERKPTRWYPLSRITTGTLRAGPEFRSFQNICEGNFERHPTGRYPRSRATSDFHRACHIFSALEEGGSRFEYRTEKQMDIEGEASAT